jgi:NADH-quinone oxidoreductase subunit C
VTADATAATLERVRAALDGRPLTAVPQRDGTLCLPIERDKLAAFARELRDRAGFETATFVTAVDHYPREPRFEVFVQLLSLQHRERVRLVTRTSSQDAVVPSIASIFPGAAFMERECCDLCGVRFAGHEPLRRLLMPQDYEHFPLRKDFPHQGLDPDRLYREWDARRRAKVE